MYRYLSFNCPGRLSGTTAQGSAIPLISITFTVLSTQEGNYTGVLFAGANPTYSNANNLVLTSDASAGINIAKQFVAQVSALPSMGHASLLGCIQFHATHLVTAATQIPASMAPLQHYAHSVVAGRKGVRTMAEVTAVLRHSHTALVQNK